MVDLNSTINLSEILDLSNFSKNFKDLENDNYNIKCLDKTFVLSIKKKDKYKKLLELIVDEKEVFDKYFLKINSIIKSDKIIENNIDDLIFVIFLDILVYFDLIKVNLFNKNITNANKFKKELSFLLKNNVNVQLNKQSKRESFNHRKQRSLINANLHSIEWKKDKKTNLNYKIIIELKKLNCNLVEIPKNYDEQELLNNLVLINKNLEHLKLKHHNFNLRFKKLGLYKKTGMFIKNTNTIIVDPRHVNDFYHELGHFIYENKLSFFFKEKRIYPSSFKNVSKKEDVSFLKKYDIEGYSKNSEMFAYWFEKTIC